MTLPRATYYKVYPDWIILIYKILLNQFFFFIAINLVFVTKNFTFRSSVLLKIITLSRMNINNPNVQFSSHYKRNEREEMLVAPPLDFSFKKATTISDLVNQQPQTIRTVKAPMRTSKDRFATSTIWLSNNLLKSTEGLENLVKAVLEDPICLSWLDLSFNEINEIGDDIAKFTNLKILYLHGNHISDINNILKLKKLCNMRTLTLHGNPVETLPYYRGYIINVMPQLVNLDFSRITISEKRRALPTGFFKVIEPAL